ncbi:MAG: cell division protein FtsQ [Flavobacterium sp.]|nr:cell division protein FtsQ [Flavobacterium sp.]
MSWLKWSNIRLILMFALMVFLYSFTSIRNEKRKLVKSEVVFVDNSSPYIKQETVNKLLIENKTDAQSIRKDKLDLNQLEKSINSNPMIEKSEVFVSIDGVLKAMVKQKTPIARVFNDESSFYIDYQGNIMPLSDEFTARVPIISGDINNINKDDFNKLLRFIWLDDFLKKNIIGIQISPVGSLKMQNRNFNYEILFGKAINIERKFQNYKAFYQKTSVDSTLSRYKRINLTFTQQVVCTK